MTTAQVGNVHFSVNFRVCIGKYYYLVTNNHETSVMTTAQALGFQALAGRMATAIKAIAAASWP